MRDSVNISYAISIVCYVISEVLSVSQLSRYSIACEMIVCKVFEVCHYVLFLFVPIDPGS